jgi:hypothetical protein
MRMGNSREQTALDSPQQAKASLLSHFSQKISQTCPIDTMICLWYNTLTIGSTTTDPNTSTLTDQANLHCSSFPPDRCCSSEKSTIIQHQWAWRPTLPLKSALLWA